MVLAVRHFLDFCYIARRNALLSDDFVALDKALKEFLIEREIFRETGVRHAGFALPRQHALIHYSENIRLFGALNGLCSSITESKHIKAVKEPWRRSNHHNALGQMLVTNQRIDKLSRSQAEFMARGLLQVVYLSDVQDEDEENSGAIVEPEINEVHPVQQPPLHLDGDLELDTENCDKPMDLVGETRLPGRAGQ